MGFNSAFKGLNPNTQNTNRNEVNLNNFRCQTHTHHKVQIRQGMKILSYLQNSTIFWKFKIVISLCYWMQWGYVRIFNPIFLISQPLPMWIFTAVTDKRSVSIFKVYEVQEYTSSSEDGSSNLPWNATVYSLIYIPQELKFHQYRCENLKSRGYMC